MAGVIVLVDPAAGRRMPSAQEDRRETLKKMSEALRKGGGEVLKKMNAKRSGLWR